LIRCRQGLLIVLALGLAQGAGLRPASAEALRILTYNTWHGFWRTPEREVLVLPSESAQIRGHRAEVQATELRRLRADVVMAQEVHPLPWRARALARASGHDSIHQLVSCGFRFLHLGIPWAIRSGLVVTANENLDLERVSAPLLSGRFGFCSDWLGLQFEESRRALLGRIVTKDGRRLLLVTTHLHSSTVGGAARTARRVREVAAVLEAIDEARRRDPEILGVILGGDFNAMSDSEPIERMRSAGFVDVSEKLGAEFATYDPWTNRLAARMTKAGGGDPAQSAPRRIDYMFVSRELEPFVRAVEPYGPKPDGAPEASFGSDHFGVLLELDL
jgi:endonuclease/exonuclease/phosphatase family metal-dependent hydrolase